MNTLQYNHIVVSTARYHLRTVNVLTVWNSNTFMFVETQLPHARCHVETPKQIEGGDLVNSVIMLEYPSKIENK